MSRAGLLGLAAVGLVGCGAAGAIVAPTTEPAATVAPTTTVPAGPSEACREAIEIAEQVFDVAADGFAAASAGFGAAAEFDIDGLERAGEDLVAVNGEVAALAPQWQAARDGCLAS